MQVRIKPPHANHRGLRTSRLVSVEQWWQCAESGSMCSILAYRQVGIMGLRADTSNE